MRKTIILLFVASVMLAGCGAAKLGPGTVHVPAPLHRR